MHKPASLKEAYEYACQYELAQDLHQKRYKPAIKPNPISTAPNSRPRGNVQPLRITYPRGELIQLRNGPSKGTLMEQRRALGLCYNCNEKHFPGHKCIRKGVHLIEEVVAETEEVEENGGEAELEQLEVSLHATSCNPNLKTMRQENPFMHSCPYSLYWGSTHSFLDPAVLAGTSYTITKTSPPIPYTCERAQDVN